MVALKYTLRCLLSIILIFIFWVGMAQLGVFLFRGTALDGFELVLAVAGMVIGVKLCFMTWPE